MFYKNLFLQSTNQNLPAAEVLIPPFYFSMFSLLFSVESSLSSSSVFLRTVQRHPPWWSKADQYTSSSVSSALKCTDVIAYLVDGSSERGEKDASKITTYPPGAVRFDCELRAVQVSCGFHHSGTFFSLLPASAHSAGNFSLFVKYVNKF